MKIDLIARGCGPQAGIERYTYELAKGLSLQHTVAVLAQPTQSAQVPGGLIPVEAPAWPHWLSVLQFSRRAGILAKQRAADICHTQGSDGTWGDCVTAHACHRAGMRASLHAHPTLGNQLRKWLSPNHAAINWLEAHTFTTAKTLIAVSKRVRRQVQACYPATRCLPFSVVYPGVDAELFSPQKIRPLRIAARQQLKLQTQAVVFLLVANSPELKGGTQLLKALALMRNPDACLVIAAAGHESAGLLRQAKKMSVAARLHFIPENMDILSVYAAADVYAILPEYESFGLTVLEAMACELPVLLSRNMGVAELIEDKKQGWLLPWLAPVLNVSAAMDDLAANAALRRQLGKAGRNLALDYSWPRMVHEVEKIYQTLL